MIENVRSPLSAAGVRVDTAASPPARWVVTLVVVVLAASVGGIAAVASLPHAAVSPMEPAPPPVAAAPVAAAPVMAHMGMHAHHAPPSTTAERPVLTGAALRRDELMQRILQARAERDGHESRRGLLLMQRAQLQRQAMAFGASSPGAASMRRELVSLGQQVAAAASAANAAAARTAALESRMGALSAATAR